MVARATCNPGITEIVGTISGTHIHYGNFNCSRGRNPTEDEHFQADKGSDGPLFLAVEILTPPHPPPPRSHYLRKLIRAPPTISASRISRY